MFIKIDNWMFAKVFQPISDWLVTRNGKGPHSLAAICGYLYSSLLVVENIYFPHESWLAIVFDVFVIMIVLDLAYKHEKAEKKISVGNSSTALNQARTNKLFQFFRITGWLICSLNVFDFMKDSVDSQEDAIRLGLSLTFTVFIYFDACETKPPAPPERKEKLVPATTRS